jgi:lysozyme
MSKLITNLEKQLLLDEGLRLMPYQDHLGFWTVGVGRLIDPRRGGGLSAGESRLILNDPAPAGVEKPDGWAKLIEARGGLRRPEALSLLMADIFSKEAELISKWPAYVNLSEPRQGALVNMAFQLGVEGLMGFRNTLFMMREGRFVEAARSARASRWAQQTPKRAARVTRQIETNEWVFAD